MKSIYFIILGLLCFMQFDYSFAQSGNNAEEAKFDSVFTDVFRGRPLFVNGNNIKDNIGKDVAYSITITPFSPSIVPTYVFHPGYENIQDGRTIGWVSNFPIREIYRILYGKPFIKDPERPGIQYLPKWVPLSQTEIVGLDTSKMVSVVNGKRHRENSWIIQLTSSSILPVNKIRKQMIGEMDLHFGLKTRWEKRVKKCIVISRNDKPIPEYNGGELDHRMGVSSKTGTWGVHMNDIPMEQFIDRLTQNRVLFFSGYPVVNETGFQGRLGKIGFSFKDPKFTFEQLKEHFAEYGMALSIQEREVDVLVIGKDETL